MLSRAAVGLAWLAVAMVALLPVAARRFEPPSVRVLSKPNTAAEGLGLMIDMLSMAAHRAWMLPATLALCGVVVVLSLGAFLVLRRQRTPWPQRRLGLFPLLALPPGLLISAMLDGYLPEFGP
jgi:hypothetical protein